MHKCVKYNVSYRQSDKCRLLNLSQKNSLPIAASMHKYVIKPKLNKVQLLKYSLECPFRDIALKLTGSLSQFRAKSKLDTRNRGFNNPLLVHSNRTSLMDDRHELCMFKICRSKALFLAPLFNDISP